MTTPADSDAMIRASSGLSLLRDPMAAGEAAAFDALLGCEGAKFVLLFASHHHAERLADAAAGAESIASGAYVSGCAGFAVATEQGPVVGAPAVAALAIGGDGIVLRPAQQRSGPVDARALEEEMGAPRGMEAYVVLAGAGAGDPSEILTRLPPSVARFGVALAGAWSEPSTTIGQLEFHRSGTLAWLIAGDCDVHVSSAPNWSPATAGDREPSFGLYLGAAGAPRPFPDVAPAFPLAGVIGSIVAVPDGAAATLITVTAGTSDG